MTSIAGALRAERALALVRSGLNDPEEVYRLAHAASPVPTPEKPARTERGRRKQAATYAGVLLGYAVLEAQEVERLTNARRRYDDERAALTHALGRALALRIDGKQSSVVDDAALRSTLLGRVNALGAATRDRGYPVTSSEISSCWPDPLSE